MRLRLNRLKHIYLYNSTLAKNPEYATYQAWNSPVHFLAEAWPGSGPVQQELYGAKLPVIRNFRINGTYTEQIQNGRVSYVLTDGQHTITLTANDGVSMDGGKDPAYKINAIYPRRWLELECEPLSPGVANGNQH